MAYGHIHDNYWPIADIIYIAIMGPIVVCAFLEWFLWLAAFLYCLRKVYIKSPHWSAKALAVLMMFLFTGFRGIFLPVMIVTLPLPSHISQFFPRMAVAALQWFAFWTFAVLLIVPWLFCVYRLVTNNLGRTKQIKEVLDSRTAPKTVIVMPVYKEEPAVLVKALDSVVECEYPASCIHVFLSYDGEEIDEGYLEMMEHLGIPTTVLDDFPTSIDVTYKSARVTVSRWKHGGKRHCQKLTFRLIDKIYERYLAKKDDLFVLFIDSDCILDRVCLQNFMYDMELKPGSTGDMLAMTGVITSTTKRNSLITLLQDLEYVHGQLFERSVESGCGTVTCLPGALTILRFSAFKRMAKYYFADKAEQCEDLFDFGKCHLGEDRWLTHLFMIGARKRYQIGMCTSAFCKTEAVQTFKSLLKQRRRWFLGFITNEACMLTDIRIWYRYPLLCIVRFMQNTIRTTALLFFIMVISVATTSNKVSNLPVGFIAVSLGLNYLLMLYFGAKLRRFKAWLYPLMFLLNPFFNWLYMVYGIFTAGQRTWGGPRADAAKANNGITPEEAVKKAKEDGDDLNVEFEGFKDAVAEMRAAAVEKELSRRGEESSKESDMALQSSAAAAAATTTGGGGVGAGYESFYAPTVGSLPAEVAIPLHPPDPWEEDNDGGLAWESENEVEMPMDIELIISKEKKRRMQSQGRGVEQVQGQAQEQAEAEARGQEQEQGQELGQEHGQGQDQRQVHWYDDCRPSQEQRRFLPEEKRGRDLKDESERCYTTTKDTSRNASGNNTSGETSFNENTMDIRIRRTYGVPPPTEAELTGGTDKEERESSPGGMV